MSTQATALQTTQSPPKPAPMAKTVKSWLTSDYFKQQVALVLPKHLKAERFCRIALSALTRIPKLAKCTPDSVVKCCLTLSELGLEPDGRRAHLIPFGNECTLIVDYKGLVELAMNSGTVSSIFAERVCEKDVFDWDTGEIKHKIDWHQDRGAMYAAYVIIKFVDGGKHTEVMTKADIDRIRKRSKASSNGPWVTDYDEMAKKTVFRRASKWVKLSPEVQELLEKSDEPPATIPSEALVSDVTELAEMNGGGEEPEALPIESEITDRTAPPPMQPAPETATRDKKPPLPTVQDTLATEITNAGHSFDDFKAWIRAEFWDEKTCTEQNVDSWGGFAEVPTQVARQLSRSLAGLLQGLAARKGGDHE